MRKSVRLLVFRWVGVLVLGILTGGVARAADLYWWPGVVEGGSGTWTTSQTNWSTTPGEKSDPEVAASLSDDVYFRGASGTVNPAGISAAFARTATVTVSGYVFDGFGASVGSFIVEDGVTATLQRAGNAVWEITDVEVESVFRGSFSDGSALMNFVKVGAGLFDLTEVSSWHSGSTSSREGTLRFDVQSLPGASLKIADVDGASALVEFSGNGTSGSFTRELGAGPGAVQLGVFGTGALANLVGFGAVNGDITISTPRSSGTAQWGNTVNSNVGIRGLTFQLGTASSTGTTIYTTSLEIRSDQLVLRSGNGESTVDADYTGAFTRAGDANSNSVLVRDGTGTLRLSGDSSAFDMRLDLQQGTTLVDGTLGSDTINATYGVYVNSGATLGGDGVVEFAGSSVQVAGTLMAGRTGMSGQSLAIDSDVNLLGDSVLQFDLGTTVGNENFLMRIGGEWVLQSDQQIRLTVGMGFVGGDGFELIRGLTFAPGYDVSGWQVVDSPALGSGEFYYALGSDQTNYSVYLNVAAIPEPASIQLLLGLALAGLLAHRKWARGRAS